MDWTIIDNVYQRKFAKLNPSNVNEMLLELGHVSVKRGGVFTDKELYKLHLTTETRAYSEVLSFSV